MKFETFLRISSYSSRISTTWLANLSLISQWEFHCKIFWHSNYFWFVSWELRPSASVKNWLIFGSSLCRSIMLFICASLPAKLLWSSICICWNSCYNLANCISSCWLVLACCNYCSSDKILFYFSLRNNYTSVSFSMVVVAYAPMNCKSLVRLVHESGDESFQRKPIYSLFGVVAIVDSNFIFFLYLLTMTLCYGL